MRSLARVGTAIRSSHVEVTEVVDETEPERVDGGFAPVSRATLSSQIRDQLLERITSGAIRPGERVPSERVLMEQFRVARTSVREAMHGLVSLGVVVRRGNRSFVVEHLPDVSFNEIDDRKRLIDELFETRRLLEVPMIELAAARATDAERSEISRIADSFDPDMSLSAFRELDRQFHVAVAAACGNLILGEVHGKVIDRLFRSEGLQSLLADESNRDEVRRVVGDAAAHHARLAAAIADGDVEAAAAEGIDHLEAFERSLIDRLE